MAIPSIGSGTVVGGRWRIVTLVGEGGFGQVFKAVDESSMDLGDAAVKVLHTNTSPAERNVFTSEVQRMATLRHQNLIGYLDSGQMEVGDETHSYLVAEFCSNSLSRFTRNQSGGCLSSDDVLAVLSDISAGLAYLHSKKMVHRDIKPANVMFGDGVWKLGDFGLTRDLSATGSYHRGDSLRGTPLYMSPELFSTMTATAASDVYAVGVLAHRCASGLALHQGSGQALIQNIISTPPAIDQSLSPAVRDIIQRCTLADPQQRPSAAQLHDLVTQYKTAPPVSVVQPTGTPPDANPAVGNYLAPTHPLSTQPYSKPSDSHGTQTRQTQAFAAPAKKSNGPKIAAVAAAICFLIAGVVAAVVAMQPSSEKTASGQEKEETSTLEQDGADNEGVVDTEGLPETIDGLTITSPDVGSSQGLSNEVNAAGHIVEGCDTSTTLGLITNKHNVPVDYRIEINHFDATDVRIGDGGFEAILALQPGQSSLVNLTGTEERTVRCEIASVEAAETDPRSIEQIGSAKISSCVRDTFFGYSYDTTVIAKNESDVVSDIEVYVAAVDGNGVRVDEDWSGITVSEVSPDSSAEESSSYFLSTVDQVTNPPEACEIIAVISSPTAG